MRVLITGCTGYIGARLAARLVSQGWETHAVLRPGSDVSRLPASTKTWIYDGAIESVSQAVSGARPDAVIHLAAAGGSDHKPADIQPLLAANLLFGTQLLEAMSLGPCSCFVNAGSYWEYASDGRYAPNSLYAATKHAFQDIVAYYCRARGLHAITLVLYDVYGPSDWRGKLIPQLVRALQTGERLAATPGEQTIDFVHIDDVCAGFLHAIRRLLGRDDTGHSVYALRTGSPIRPRDVAARLEAAAGRPLRIGWGEIPYRTDQIFQPAESIPLLPGWRPSVTLEAGLRQAISGADSPEERHEQPS